MRRACWRTGCLFLAVGAGWAATGCSGGSTALSTDPTAATENLLPPEITAAWQKAGAEVGWMGPNRKHGHLQFTAVREDLFADQAVPAFAIGHWREGMLAKLPKPERAFGLNLANSGITDPGLRDVARFEHLAWLSLSGGAVTDAVLRELAGLKQLTALDLSVTLITDTGLRELTGLKQLTWLSLSGTQVTDAGLKELAVLKPLARLELRGTQVTDQGEKELQLALPTCKISR